MAVKERPIIFSGSMVKAILDGRKSQTRRPIKPQPTGDCEPFETPAAIWDGAKLFFYEAEYPEEGSVPWGGCPYGKPGDRLWVRETAKLRSVSPPAKFDLVYLADDEMVDFARSDAKPYNFLRPTSSIYMPRWASRITLEIVSVRVERVQEISGKDAEAEGVNLSSGEALWPHENRSSKMIAAFKRSWQSIHGPGAWERNNWVWAIEFKRVAVAA